MPKVSVIIPTYKRAEMLDRAIKSVLKQTYKNIEAIVVDDNNFNSEHRRFTKKVMKKYQENKKVKYIQHEFNKNGAAARNTGIKHSTGEILSFLDDDDWFLEEKVEKQVLFLLNNPQYKAVYCGWERNNKEVRPEKKGDLSFELLSGECKIFTNTIVIWKHVAIEIGGWNEEFIRNQEAVFLLRLFNHRYQIGVIPEVLVIFDTSDRSNRLSPRENKKIYDLYLKSHEKTIKEIEKKNKNAKKLIYSKRYRGVLFSMLKKGDLVGAIKHYFSTCKRFPVCFNKEIIGHLLSYKKNKQKS